MHVDGVRRKVTADNDRLIAKLLDVFTVAVRYNSGAVVHW